MSFERLEPTNTPTASGDAAHAPATGGAGLRAWHFAILGVWSLLHLLRLVGLVVAARLTRLLPRQTAPGDEGVRRPVLFFYSQVAWDEVWQRPQEFSLRLARRFDVVFFGPLQMHRKFQTGRRINYRQRVRAGGEQVLAVTPWTFPGTYKSPLINRINQFALRHEAMLACPEPPDVVITNSPFPDWLPAVLRPRLMAMDFMDDFTAFDWSPHDSAERQARLVQRSSLLLAGTRYLASAIAARTGRPCTYVPSGVDLERWTHDLDVMPGESPELFREYPRPRIGYAGSIGERLDVDILRAIARANPGGSLLLLGPVYGGTLAEFSEPNAHLLGNRQPAELPSLVRHFDVALIPFKLNEATRALNPIKALEYLAAGVPVVATPLPDVVAEFADVVDLANGPEEFVGAVGRLLAMTPQQRRARAEAGRAAVAGRTWAATGDRFAELVSDALAPPAAQ